MDRRTYLGSLISGALAGLAGCSDNREPCASHSVTADCDPCESCERLQEIQTEWLYELASADREKELELLMDPEHHDWTDDCKFTEAASRFEDEEGYTEEEIRDMDYSIGVDFDKGVLAASVVFNPKPTMDQLSCIVTVGDAGP